MAHTFWVLPRGLACQQLSWGVILRVAAWWCIQVRAAFQLGSKLIGCCVDPEARKHAHDGFPHSQDSVRCKQQGLRSFKAIGLGPCDGCSGNWATQAVTDAISSEMSVRGAQWWHFAAHPRSRKLSGCSCWDYCILHGFNTSEGFLYAWLGVEPSACAANGSARRLLLGADWQHAGRPRPTLPSLLPTLAPRSTLACPKPSTPSHDSPPPVGPRLTPAPTPAPHPRPPPPPHPQAIPR